MAVPRKSEGSAHLHPLPSAPLIVVLRNVDGDEVEEYFTSVEAADAAITLEMRAETLAAVGAWSDIDFDELIEDLDRIRHSTLL